jgi:hypothetical protein
MTQFKTLSVAALLVTVVWSHVAAQVPTHPLPNAPAPDKAKPTSLAEPNAGAGPPFAVIESKRREIPSDLAVADGLGIRAVRITGPASIQGIAPAGQAFRWVLTLEGELWGLPMLDRHLVFTEKDRDIIKHDVVTRGGPVKSAGKAQVQGNTLLIDPRSGHYHPTPASVKQLAEPAFKAAGFEKVQTVDNILSD